MIKNNTQIELIRVYDAPTPGGTFGVLVDRLWPRGVENDERILYAINCSVLAIKPASFVSSIKVGDYIDVSRGRSNED